MNRAITSLFSVALLGSAALAQAEPAIYQNGVLSIPQGGLFTDQREVYYTDIKLSTDADGRLTIVQANKMPLAHVEAVEVVVGGTDDGLIWTPEVTLEVDGYFPNGCSQSLLEPAVTQRDGEFIVLLAQTVVPADMICTLLTSPFTTDIPLDVSGVEPGTYTVRVNDVETSFELPASL
jgi:hypothetical protein